MAEQANLNVAAEPVLSPHDLTGFFSLLCQELIPAGRYRYILLQGELDQGLGRYLRLVSLGNYFGPCARLRRSLLLCRRWHFTYRLGDSIEEVIVWIPIRSTNLSQQLKPNIPGLLLCRTGFSRDERDQSLLVEFEYFDLYQLSDGQVPESTGFHPFDEGGVDFEDAHLN